MLVQNTRDIGRLIRKRRQELGLTQAQLATMYGTTQKWISYVENGKDTVPVGQVLRLLKTMGLILDVNTLGEENHLPADSKLSRVIERHK